MPGVVPGIHVSTAVAQTKAWLAGTSPAMTNVAVTCLAIHPSIEPATIQSSSSRSSATGQIAQQRMRRKAGVCARTDVKR
jgi:hypothetical protein